MVYPSIPWALVFAWISIQKTSRCPFLGTVFFLRKNDPHVLFFVAKKNEVFFGREVREGSIYIYRYTP